MLTVISRHAVDLRRERIILNTKDMSVNIFFIHDMC
jgi:hypothetical protein